MPESRKPETPAASPKLEQLGAMPAIERVAYFEANPEEYHRMLGESLVQGLNAKTLQGNP